MEETIKNIISGFINVPADQIGPSTPIDRPAFKSSILFHRMYARLAEAGVAIDNVGNMRVVGDLLTHTRPSGSSVRSSAAELSAPAPIAVRSADAASAAAGPSIGIDIEEIANLPRALDFRKDAFYTANFTPAETSYCILQIDPYSSFAGLFAAKEAIVKADNQLKGKFFSTLEITHTGEGKPVYPGFELSIAHAAGVAIAVAVRGNQRSSQPVPALQPAPPAKTSWLTVMAILLSLAALLLAVIRRA